MYFEFCQFYRECCFNSIIFNSFKCANKQGNILNIKSKDFVGGFIINYRKAPCVSNKEKELKAILDGYLCDLFFSSSKATLQLTLFVC